MQAAELVVRKHKQLLLAQQRLELRGGQAPSSRSRAVLGAMLGLLWAGDSSEPSVAQLQSEVGVQCKSHALHSISLADAKAVGHLHLTQGLACVQHEGSFGRHQKSQTACSFAALCKSVAT